MNQLKDFFDLLVFWSGFCEILGLDLNFFFSDIGIWWRINCRVLVGFWFSDMGIWKFWWGNRWWCAGVLILLGCCWFDLYSLSLWVCCSKFWFFWTLYDIRWHDSPFVHLFSLWLLFYSFDFIILSLWKLCYPWLESNNYVSQ